MLPLATSLSNGRFSIVRKLGQGAMGVVYETFDTVRNELVALKTLPTADPTGVYRLKNEFRALSGLLHPNLVHMYELFGDPDVWFFTMELVDGEPFDRWVRPNGALNEARLRVALPQLVRGVWTLHEAGKVHRDLKPSNVLVNRSGRLVVLDFGLSGAPDPGSPGQTVPTKSWFGTPEYMAPEQAAGERATAASDAYAIGSMLFEALSGRLPFEGSLHAMLAKKIMHEAPLALLGQNPPSDLASACADLLVREPDARLSIGALHARLATDPGERHPLRRTEPATRLRALAMRSAPLRELRAASQAASDGARPVVVLLSHRKGSARTGPLEHFLDDLRDQAEAVVLAARCSEREKLPLRGLDPLMDDLSRHLRKQSALHLAGLIPRDVDALSRVFPVIGRIEAIAQAPVRAFRCTDVLRRRARSALGEMLARMRDRQPLVLAIDDLQWSDAESIAWLLALLRRREATRMLLILSHRAATVADHAALQRLYDGLAANRRVDVRRVSIAKPDHAGG